MQTKEICSASSLFVPFRAASETIGLSFAEKSRTLCRLLISEKEFTLSTLILLHERFSIFQNIGFHYDCLPNGTEEQS
jgi:hypothetical protein